VYIAEAHADDEWPVASARYNEGKEVHVLQTKSVLSRTSQAQSFFQNFSYSESQSQWKLLVAPPEEDTNSSKIELYGF